MNAQPSSSSSTGLTRLAAALAAIAVIIGVVVAVVGDADEAAAAELEPFADCAELRAWAEEAAGTSSPGFDEVPLTTFMPDAAEADTAAAPATGGDGARSTSGEASTAGTGATNVQVEGIDELDIIDSVGTGRVVVIGQGAFYGEPIPVDVPGGGSSSQPGTAATEPAPPEVATSVVPDTTIPDTTIPDTTTTVVEPTQPPESTTPPEPAPEPVLALVDVETATVLDTRPVGYGAQLTADPERGVVWVLTTDGTSLEVQRIGIDGDQFGASASWAVEGYLVDARRDAGRLHVVAGSSLIDGDGDAAVPFGGEDDAPVPCSSIVHPPAPSQPTATLVATLDAGTAAAGDSIEPVGLVEVAGSGDLVYATADALYVATPLYGETTLETSIHRFTLDELAYTGSGRVPGTLLNRFALDDHEGFLRVAVTEGDGVVGIEPVLADDVVEAPTRSAEAAIRNRVVILDTEGELDEVGRTEPFGKPNESIFGVRFAGATGYVVTFLQTDPLYVLDLGDPTAPAVLGELEVPGFSAYLHPFGPVRVVGFGPDGESGTVARLFDVADPTAPSLVDTLALAPLDGEVYGDSPVVYDPHAFTGLGTDRFAVPATGYREQPAAGCTPGAGAAAQARADELSARLEELYRTPGADAQIEALIRDLDVAYQDPCLYPQQVAEHRVMVVTVGEAELNEELRFTVPSGTDAPTRIVPDADRYVVLAGSTLYVHDSAGNPVASVPLAAA